MQRYLLLSYSSYKVQTSLCVFSFEWPKYMWLYTYSVSVLRLLQLRKL